MIERKIKEIIQSVRVTETYPGEAGKQRIIEAYLNQNYYGNGSYGVLAAARSYFGVDSLAELRLGQVALLAALPQSPSTYDLVRNAIAADDGTLYVPLDAGLPVVERRNYILNLLATDPTRRVLTTDTFTSAPVRAGQGRADHPRAAGTPAAAMDRAALRLGAARRAGFATVLGGRDLPGAGARRPAGHQLARLEHAAGSREMGHRRRRACRTTADPEAYAAELGVPYQNWMKKLGNLEVNNGALIALDYQTGEILAYVGSAGFYRDEAASPQFQPQFDVLGDGWRQPGSAFKPFNYVTGINDGTLTAASMFMDVTTTFANSSGYTPKDYDLLERGPVRMRSAIQWSLNIPAVKALVVNGVDHVFDTARRFGMTFQNERPRAGLSLTLGTEVTHPRDVAVSYATLANGGSHIGYTHVLRITDSVGSDLVDPHVPPPGEAVVSPQAAFVMTDILASNTNPRDNPIWGDFAVNAADGTRRPAALKTGTNNDANDLVAFGYLAPPDQAGRDAGEYALVVGAWNGNSDGSPVLTAENPVLSTDVAAPLWSGFLEEVTAAWPIRDFAAAGGYHRGRGRCMERHAPDAVHQRARHRGLHRRHGARRGHDQGRAAGC